MCTCAYTHKYLHKSWCFLTSLYKHKNITSVTCFSGLCLQWVNLRDDVTSLRIKQAWKEVNVLVMSHSFDPMDCSLADSSVHWILQARILEWVAIPFFRGSSWPTDWTQGLNLQAVFFTIWVIREGPLSVPKLSVHLVYQNYFLLTIKTVEPLVQCPSSVTKICYVHGIHLGSSAFLLWKLGSKGNQCYMIHCLLWVIQVFISDPWF